MHSSSAAAMVATACGLFLSGCNLDDTRDAFASCNAIDFPNGRVRRAGKVECDDGYKYTGPEFNCHNKLIELCPELEHGEVKNEKNCVAKGGFTTEGDQSHKEQSELKDQKHNWVKKNINVEAESLQADNRAKYKALVTGPPSLCVKQADASNATKTTKLFATFEDGKASRVASTLAIPIGVGIAILGSAVFVIRRQFRSARIVEGDRALVGERDSDEEIPE